MQPIRAPILPETSYNPAPDRMTWWRRLLGEDSPKNPRPQKLDYLSEALALERQGDYDAALTSYRLALRDRPNDPRILQNMGIAFSRTGRIEEAIRSYRRALDLDGKLTGAHYGLAFLLLKKGEVEGAEEHLGAFLANAPSGPEAERWVAHARRTLAELRPSPSADPDAAERQQYRDAE